MAAPAQPAPADSRPANPYRIAAYYLLALVGLLAVGMYDIADTWNRYLIPLGIVLIAASYIHLIHAAESYAIFLAVRRDVCDKELRRRNL